MEVLNDQNLANMISNQDPAAEKEFVRLFYGKIKMIVSMRVNDSEDVKELIDDILIAAVLKIRNGSFDTERESSLANYIYGIARNIINQYLKNLYKKRDREKLVNNELFDDKISAEFERFEFERNEEIMENKKIWRNLIGQLKPKYRDIIYLRYYENLAVSEIAKKLDLPPQKVSDNLKYAKQLLMQGFTNKK